jgi:hypothetical protein
MPREQGHGTGPGENAKVASVPPPKAVIAVANPVVKLMSRTPLGRVLGPVGVLRFTGRRSGRPLEIATGIHDIGGGAYGVFSSSPWRLNFRGGVPVEVLVGGRRRHGRAELVEDRAEIGRAFLVAMEHASLRTLGLIVEKGHQPTAAELGATGRALIWISYDD